MAELFYRFGTAIAIGLLIGLQREFARGTPESEKELFAGVRTFPLIALTGASGALVAEELGTPWGFLVPAAAVVGLVIAAYAVTSKRSDVGVTTEVAAILTLLIGALCYFDRLAVAVALGVIVTMFLSIKPELHRFTHRLTREDLGALVKFAVITAVILPVLPNEGLGPPPFDVLNPHKIWLMVILIAGLSFLGYAVIKLVGSDRGIALTGLLGGLASSTAVTLTFSQRSRRKSARELSKTFAVAIVVAWVTMFLRIVVEVGIINRALLAWLWTPMALAAGTGSLYCVHLSRSAKAERADSDVEFSNPFELGPALRFGALYGAILFISRIAQLQLGDGGVYLSALGAGATDVDAITLSLAELSRSGGDLDPVTASRAVTLAAVSNTVVKTGIVLVTGSRELSRAVLPGFVLILAAALGAAFVGLNG